MSKAVITESSLSDIGDAIRTQLNVTTEYLPSEMADAVLSITGGGTTDYTELSNKPQINSVELSGDKSSSDLGLQDALSFDSTPTSGSTNPVTSGGVYTALSGKVDTSAVGSASGVAELDENGHVPSSQLPSYVDDVIEGYYDETNDKFYEDSSYTTEIEGETGKIYITLDTNLSYRWSGTGFVVISPSLALGETSSTAYRGDRGATAYSTSQTNASAISGINTALGSTDISSVGDGTVTGAISTLNNSLSAAIKTTSQSVTVSMADGYSYSFSYTPNAISGYTCVGVIGAEMNETRFILEDVTLSSFRIRYFISGSSYGQVSSHTPTIYLLYVKTDLL